MGATLSDVPGTYDLVIQVNGGGNTTGYILNDAIEPSVSFKTAKAVYTHTPTFIERSNVSGDYGDNQQDFFLTATQRDWSEGEQQRYFRASDGDSVRRFWQGSAIDVTSIPGQVTLRRGIASASVTPAGPLAISGLAGAIFFATATNLKRISSSGNVTDHGAHGLGTGATGICGDEVNVYLTSQGGGTVGVRKWNGAAFSTFSASSAGQIEYLNNTLYGYRASSANGDLVRWDTGGTLTSIFTWKAADGTVANASNQNGMLKAFGGKLLILLPWSSVAALPSELWIYDGTAPSKVAEFQPNFIPNQMAISQGTVYISGILRENDDYRPAVYYYASGNLGLLWKASVAVALASTGNPGIATFAEGVVFNDDTQGKILFYSQVLGGIHPIAAWAAGASLANSYFVCCADPGFFGGKSGSDTNIQYYPTSTTVSTGTLTTSLFDFDSSLTKLFRGVTVEFDAGTDGNGGTVDVAYRVGDVVGSYTSAATGVTSGSETSLSGVNGRSISIKVTLNKGTSTSGPTLKRIMVRAAPILTRKKLRKFTVNCSGNPATEDRMRLRNGDTHPLSGREQVDQLILAAESIVSNPGKYCTFTDRFGQYDGVVESLEIFEQHPSKDADASHAGSFVCELAVREV